eukprot:TRINITY_DN17170_c0_g1_i1.p1 TRINITY_DN17170_c0_g1~~TRINITY_DN17170_c0_g1_i1.p1  ORF type:complete len:337 (+),score=72.37 TRINITY_DN17170_c0_g1_i1:249-1259(+)
MSDSPLIVLAPVQHTPHGTNELQEGSLSEANESAESAPENIQDDQTQQQQIATIVTQVAEMRGKVLHWGRVGPGIVYGIRMATAGLLAMGATYWTDFADVMLPAITFLGAVVAILASSPTMGGTISMCFQCNMGSLGAALVSWPIIQAFQGHRVGSGVALAIISFVAGMVVSGPGIRNLGLALMAIIIIMFARDDDKALDTKLPFEIALTCFTGTMFALLSTVFPYPDPTIFRFKATQQKALGIIRHLLKHEIHAAFHGCLRTELQELEQTYMVQDAATCLTKAEALEGPMLWESPWNMSTVGPELKLMRNLLNDLKQLRLRSGHKRREVLSLIHI